MPRIAPVRILPLLLACMLFLAPLPVYADPAGPDEDVTESSTLETETVSEGMEESSEATYPARFLAQEFEEAFPDRETDSAKAAAYVSGYLSSKGLTVQDVKAEGENAPLAFYVQVDGTGEVIPGHLTIVVCLDVNGAQAACAVTDLAQAALSQESSAQTICYAFVTGGETGMEDFAAYEAEHGCTGFIQIRNMAYGDRVYVYQAGEESSLYDSIRLAARRLGCNLWAIPEFLQAEHPEACIFPDPTGGRVPSVILEKSAWTDETQGGGNADTFGTCQLQSTSGAFAATGGLITGTEYDSFEKLTHLGLNFPQDDSQIFEVLCHLTREGSTEAVTEKETLEESKGQVLDGRGIFEVPEATETEMPETEEPMQGKGLSPLFLILPILAVCVIAAALVLVRKILRGDFETKPADKKKSRKDARKALKNPKVATEEEDFLTETEGMSEEDLG